MDFFAVNVKYLRKQKGLNQTEIAAAIGVGQSAWSEYEIGTSKPNFNDLLKIIEYFGITASELLEIELQKGNLNSKNEDQKRQEKGKVISNPIGNLNTKKLADYSILNTFENALEQALNEEQVPYETAQEQMRDLAGKVAKIEAFIAKLARENEARGKPRPKRPTKK